MYFSIVVQSSGNIRPLPHSHHILNVFQSFLWSSSGTVTL